MWYGFCFVLWTHQNESVFWWLDFCFPTIPVYQLQLKDQKNLNYFNYSCPGRMANFVMGGSLQNWLQYYFRLWRIIQPAIFFQMMRVLKIPLTCIFMFDDCRKKIKLRWAFIVTEWKVVTDQKSLHSTLSERITASRNKKEFIDFSDCVLLWITQSKGKYHLSPLLESYSTMVSLHSYRFTLT